MRKIAVLLACLACVGDGRRTQNSAAFNPSGVHASVGKPAATLAQSTALHRLPVTRMSEESNSGLDHTAKLEQSPSLKVAVAGATGRVGQIVVQKLVEGGHTVMALTRNITKTLDVLPASANIEPKVLDLGTASEDELQGALSGVDALIWCAVGFTADGKSLDVKGMTELPKAFKEGTGKVPRIVMLSSAAITRTVWSDEKKERLVGAADIPIVRLNPGGVLDSKREAESLLRASDAPYCIVRPTGFNFFEGGWPQGRPIFSQGDVAVGRTNPWDLAEVLCSVLSEPEATGKTFEMFTLVGYPPADEGLGNALARLKPDVTDAGPELDESAVDATYVMMQQFLPGEKQDATKLEMGRTYEQIDRGEVAPRERGAAPSEREVELASGLAFKGGGKRQAIKDFMKRVVR